jgi:hypothetical protein
MAHKALQRTITGPLAEWMIQHRQARMLVCDHGPRDAWAPWLLWYEGESLLPCHLPILLVQRLIVEAPLAYEVVPVASTQLDLF